MPVWGIFVPSVHAHCIIEFPFELLARPSARRTPISSRLT